MLLGLAGRRKLDGCFFHLKWSPGAKTLEQGQHGDRTGKRGNGSWICIPRYKVLIAWFIPNHQISEGDQSCDGWLHCLQWPAWCHWAFPQAECKDWGKGQDSHQTSNHAARERSYSPLRGRFRGKLIILDEALYKIPILRCQLWVECKSIPGRGCVTGRARPGSFRTVWHGTVRSGDCTGPGYWFTRVYRAVRTCTVPYNVVLVVAKRLTSI